MLKYLTMGLLCQFSPVTLYVAMISPVTQYDAMIKPFWNKNIINSLVAFSLFDVSYVGSITGGVLNFSYVPHNT